VNPPRFHRSRRFANNLLASDQEEIAGRFVSDTANG
jgi:hypothetical protein